VLLAPGDSALAASTEALPGTFHALVFDRPLAGGAPGERRAPGSRSA